MCSSDLGNKWSEAEMKTTGKASKLSLTPEKTVINSDDDELAFIKVAVCDSKNNVVPRTNNRIKFIVEGAGEIVSTDNGNPIDFMSFKSHERDAFNGLALVIVKAKKDQKGKIIVRAESDNLKSAKVEILNQ